MYNCCGFDLPTPFIVLNVGCPVKFVAGISFDREEEWQW